MKWEIIVLWESSNRLGDHCRSYTVDSLTRALHEKFYIMQKEPTATVIVKRVKQ